MKLHFSQTFKGSSGVGRKEQPLRWRCWIESPLPLDKREHGKLHVFIIGTVSASSSIPGVTAVRSQRLRWQESLAVQYPLMSITSFLTPMPEWFFRMWSTLLEKSLAISSFPQAFLFIPSVVPQKIRLGWHLQDCRKAWETHAAWAASRIGIRECIWRQMSCMQKHGREVQHHNYNKGKWKLTKHCQWHDLIS